MKAPARNRYSHHSLLCPTGRTLRTFLSSLLFMLLIHPHSQADEKVQTVRTSTSSPIGEERKLFLRPPSDGARGHRITIGRGDAELPLVVVRGRPYEMGRQLGVEIRDQMEAFLPQAMAKLTAELEVSEEDLREVWARTAAFTDDRVEQEMAGLADGSGMRLSLLQAMHAVPLLMPYSCSSIAVWGEATDDGHLYQTRNLDWSLEVGAHEFPVIVVYVPEKGIPHVVPTFVGMIGAHTGLNARGLALAEMGDASAKEMPYQVHAPHFTTFFRTMLYDADSLTRALEIFQSQPMTKRYHYVFGDGQTERRAVKIRAHAPEPLGARIVVWSDDDPTDEFAPNILPCVVYNDEGRGAFPVLQRDYGKLNGQKLVELANRIPIKGGNVVNVVYDATALRLWISYAKGAQEAYQRPCTFLDLATLDADQDGKPDLFVR